MHDPITVDLLRWYDSHKRTLPWRGIHDPYATWVSEIMLQQTRVETVLRYYDRFMERFPTVTALAEAPVEDVLKQWEGLGYYRRARGLHEGAQQVAAQYGGVIPDDPAALRKLKGIGDYTAGAIASIAYGRRVPAVDGNVIRVISRLMGVRENTAQPSVRRQITALAADLLPGDSPGDFNQALMDLGAAVCTPGTPDCDHCPLRGSCDACAAGDAEELPILPDRVPPRELYWDVCLIRSGNRLLMRQRTETMLQGLWVFPMCEADKSGLPSRVKQLCGITVNKHTKAGTARHVFTHQVWQMNIHTMETTVAEAPPGWRFFTIAEMEQLPIPSAMRGPLSSAKSFLMGQE